MKDDVTKLIRDFIQDELLNNARVPDCDENLFASGLMDSLALFTLILFLNKTFKVSFKIAELQHEKFNTIDAIAARVREKQSGHPS